MDRRCQRNSFWLRQWQGRLDLLLVPAGWAAAAMKAAGAETGTLDEAAAMTGETGEVALEKAALAKEAAAKAETAVGVAAGQGLVVVANVERGEAAGVAGWELTK